MTIISQPRTTLQLASAGVEVGPAPQRVLLVGQMTSGLATPGELVEMIDNDTNTPGSYFGSNSMVASVIRAFKRINQQTELDVLPLSDNGSGVAREVTITYAGTATESGEFKLNVAGEKFVVPIASGTTAAALATATAALINGSSNNAFTAAALAAVVTLTAVHPGKVANGYNVGVSGMVAGVTHAVAETVAGAGDPILTSILDGLDKRYQGVVWPYAEDTLPIREFLEARFAAENKVIDGVAFTAAVDSASNLVTAFDSINSQVLVVFGDKANAETSYIGPAQPIPGHDKAALFAAARALRLTPGAAIGNLLTSQAGLDQFGGPALASLPYFNTVLPLPAPGTGRGFTDQEIENLFDVGVSVMGTNVNGSNGLVGEVVTTAQTDPAGNPDPTFGFLNFVDTMSVVREFFFSNFKTRFAQSRLTEGALAAGRDIANALSIRAFTESLYARLASPDFVLTQDGPVALDFFKSNLSVTLDLSTGTVQLVMFVPIVTQLRTIIGTIKIAFSTNG